MSVESGHIWDFLREESGKGHPPLLVYDSFDEGSEINAADFYHMFLESYEGIVIAPTFTSGFASGGIFDIAFSPADRLECLGEYLRKLPNAVRSADPLFSHSGVGKGAAIFLKIKGNDSFAENGLYADLVRAGCQTLVIGADSFASMATLLWMDRILSLPNRYTKLYSGYIKNSFETRFAHWLSEKIIPAKEAEYQLDGFIREAATRGILKKSPEMDIYKADLGAFLELYREMAEKNGGWGCLKGKPKNLAACAAPSLALSSSSLEEIAKKITPLNRNIISPGFDTALNAIADIIPLRIEKYPSGTNAFSWVVPERWTCREARLETLEGKTLFSLAHTPLHVMAYSQSVNSVVSRQELFQHLHVHPKNPDAIPYVLTYYNHNWGLACSENQKRELRDSAYRVVIDSDFAFGELKTGEIIAKGKSDASFVFCGHLCHPCQFNDGLSGVLAGIKVLENLRRRQNLNYTWRMLIVPETIGSACWLSRHMDLVPSLKGGMFLEMLATGLPFWAQHSAFPKSYADMILSAAFAQARLSGVEAEFLSGPRNDERMFNAPGINCPMLSLMRVSPEEDWFREYHTQLDDFEHANLASLQDSINFILEYVDMIENDVIPEPLFTGEIFTARYNSLDYGVYGELLRYFTYQMDGKKSVAEISLILKTDFKVLLELAKKLRDEDLVLLTPVNWKNL